MGQPASAVPEAEPAVVGMAARLSTPELVAMVAALMSLNALRST